VNYRLLEWLKKNNIYKFYNFSQFIYNSKISDSKLKNLMLSFASIYRTDIKIEKVSVVWQRVSTFVKYNLTEKKYEIWKLNGK
jgi:hypothetical protein